VPQLTRPGSKGRPTPKRRDAEAARVRPLVQDRKTAGKEQKAKARETREREYQAMLSGDERNLPYRDKGPVRRWVRDYVDARRNLGEFLLPFLVVVMLTTFAATANPVIFFGANILLYVFTLWVGIDSWLLARRIKRLATEKFGTAKVPERIGFYGVMRTFQLRRSRLPRPQVKRGEFPAA